MYYKISHGSVTLGNNTVLEDINFCVKDNEKIGIVGRNGCGKTTLLKAIIGEYEINSGYEEVDIISSGDFNIGYVKQNDDYSLDMKMIDYIRSSFKDILDIEATIYCERESHKGMVIGKKGAMLKKISTYARQDLENFLQIKVNLHCWGKVKEDWRTREGLIHNFGLDNK